jgi:beta-glucosidase-like glycosyl hydrolase
LKIARYGRNSELPGEDPVLTAAYAVAYTQGMQQIKAGKSGKKYLKMLSYMKHYTGASSTWVAELFYL